MKDCTNKIVIWPEIALFPSSLALLLLSHPYFVSSSSITFSLHSIYLLRFSLSFSDPLHCSPSHFLFLSLFSHTFTPLSLSHFLPYPFPHVLFYPLFSVSSFFISTSLGPSPALSDGVEMMSNGYISSLFCSRGIKTQ